MHEEVQGLVANMEHVVAEDAGQRTYYKGVLFGREVVVVFSRWGKVAAATTATHLINYYNPDHILFTGVAGAVHHKLNVGDVVVGNKLYQHDMDARPLMKQFEIPLLGKTFFETDETFRKNAFEAITLLQNKEQLINGVDTNELSQYNIHEPKVYLGDVASGDKFFNTTAQKNELLAALPKVFCVEMEGAAVAQVCYEYGIPFNIIRIISDVADDNAHIDFPAFIRNVASHYSVAIVKEII